MNYLHPLFHGHAYQVGSRIDIERMLPPSLADEDCDLLIDDFSEPLRFMERIAPVSTQIGAERIRARNWTELMIKSFRVLSRIFTHVTLSIQQTIQVNFGQRGMVPFLSIDFDADALHRIIEMDYDTSENTYGRLMELYSKGVLSPVVSIPFHVILPLLKDEFYTRMMVRIALDFYWPILVQYHKFIRKVHNEKGFIVPLWLPEGGYSEEILKIIVDEMQEKAKTERTGTPHLLLLLDNFQCDDEENDILMKSWNVVKYGSGKSDFCSVVFRDRNFSDWVTHSKPSVKKLLDRTIAKVDSDLNAHEVDYSWAHFEDIHALCYSQQAARNFEQKIIKLTELGYMPVAPDIYIRRKLVGKFGRAKHEPRKVQLHNNSSWGDWHRGNMSLGRWVGLMDSNADTPLVDENRPFFRHTEKGQIEEAGSQGWKIGLSKTIEELTHFVMGDHKKLNGGMLGVLAQLSGAKKKDVQKNVEAFILRYCRTIWREHYLYHGEGEADLNLVVYAEETLCAGADTELTEEEVLIAGTAAQAFYFCMRAHKSFGLHWENLDQRAAYQIVTMISLAMVNAAYVYQWLGQKDKVAEVEQKYEECLIGFQNAYERLSLANYGVKKEEWADAIKSFVKECDMNLVERASRRIAARHLRPLGFTKQFPKQDENLTTNVGHIWSSEFDHSNFNWDNILFCGVEEE
ncbi:hypothetical protein JXA32_14205 [Candidatus Sumerlaeota bacterium]|nr:hypothetical protein [Candidatus Sumerlaeota bacterium]